MRDLGSWLGLAGLAFFMAIFLSGCGWEPLVPPAPPEENPAPAEVQAKIVYECSGCVRPEGGAAPLTFTFQAKVSLPDPEREKILVYTWDFGDGTKDEGERVTHTYERPGTYRVRLRVITSLGREALDELRLKVEPPPQPEARVQHDITEGELCSFERILPEAIRVGERFSVQVILTAKKDVQVAVWEDNVWFPEFRLLQEPSQLWIGLKAGERVTLLYDVQLWQTPLVEDVWMSGMFSCNPGGNSESEILILRSQLNVLPEENP